jgi:hypothetical protein
MLFSSVVVDLQKSLNFYHKRDSQILDLTLFWNFEFVILKVGLKNRFKDNKMRLGYDYHFQCHRLFSCFESYKRTIF